MASTLRVDPAGLRAAAAAQADVGAFVSGMGIGQLLRSAANAMSGLRCGEACEGAGTAFDEVGCTVNDELSEHSDRLSAAADRYRDTDNELGRRLGELAE